MCKLQLYPNDSKMRDKHMTIKPGIYQHYKGPKYKVEYVATHSETN